MALLRRTTYYSSSKETHRIKEPDCPATYYPIFPIGVRPEPTFMIAIVTPCFNEQNTVLSFLDRLEDVLAQTGEKFQVIVVDDCSQDNSLQQLSTFRFRSAGIRLTTLHLKFNLGQQGAIHQGLLYAARQEPDQVIVMDCDGEDDPRAIPLLLQQKQFEVVRVKRGRRSESFLFRLLYSWYKLVFRFITGKKIDFGNYCMISRDMAERIRHTSFVHLPAYLLKQKATTYSIRFDRSKRINGKSKMGYKGLFLHAFKSMVEFAEDLLMMFFRLFLVNVVLFVAIMINIVYQKFIAHTAILGWFSTVAVSLLILAVLSIGFFITGVLLLNLMHQQSSKSYREIYTVVTSNEYIQPAKAIH
jgi:glycosyltransferase involved in cell wall biosynthesis